VPTPLADLLMSGPSCVNLSTQRSDVGSFAGCYGSTDSSKDSELCESALTYKYGFRDALTSCKAQVALFENVATVLHSMRNTETGKIEEPAAAIIFRDLRERGYRFSIVRQDSSNYCVRQRRNRAIGIADFHQSGSDEVISSTKLTL
jgi:site-specific DNA-cytosine methylase